MEVIFFERKYNHKEISIEKLFTNIKEELIKREIRINSIQNPYSFGLINIIKGMFFFKKRQKQINHITGDIHWAAILLNPNRTVLTVHDLGRYDEIKGISRAVFYLLWIYIPLKRLKYITCISEKTKKDILRFLPEIEDKIQVIPDCLTIKTLKETRDKNKRNVLMVGTRSNKNIERAIEALEGLDIHLTIIGELTPLHIDLLNENKIDYINEKFISDKDLEKCYNAAYILLFVSIFEGFGLPILEGQASNCLIITSNLKPMLDVAGDAAIFVDPYSIKGIRQGVMEAIYMDATLKNDMIKKGHINILKYSVENVANEYIGIYNKILKSNL